MSTTALPVEPREATPPAGAAAAAPSGAAPPVAAPPVTVIQARTGLRLIDWRELYVYRDLLRFLVWRELKVRYAQSAVGIGWAVIQPLFSMLLFTVVFGSLAKVGSDGAPYALFSLAALVPWTYFSNAVTDGVSSLVSEANTLRKVYFPRVLLPLSAVLAKLVDFCIAMIVLVVLMAGYRQVPSPSVAMLPILIMLMMGTALGISVWLTALAVQYRDVKHGMSFVVQLAMYASPVVYPTSLLPETYPLTPTFSISPQLLYALNPMVGVIEGFRSALLGTQPMPWHLLGVGATSAAVVLLTGLAFFHSKERVFADVA